MLNLKKFIAFVLKFIDLSGFNPVAVEWALHYVGGSQTPRRLPSELVKYTKGDLLDALNYAFNGATLKGWALCRPADGYDAWDWLHHPTAGVVGGFVYEMTGWEDRFIFSCTDTWDFNPKKPSTDPTDDLFPSVIPIPEGVPKMVLKAIEAKFPGSLIYYESCGEWFVDEDWLAQFNNKHSFTTTWEVVVDGGEELSCQIFY